jgi:DNA-3-methyladenine glycosylase I
LPANLNESAVVEQQHKGTAAAPSAEASLSCQARSGIPRYVEAENEASVAPCPSFLSLQCRAMTKIRCGWCGTDPLYVDYHDREWGVPVHDDRTLFEFLVLEGAQAGLSWITILRKRDAYRLAFAGFDVERVAGFGAKETQRLLTNAGIVRNRLKIESAVKNARAFLKVVDEFGSFDRYQWRFVDGRPVVNRRRTLKDIPPRTEVSDAMSKDLKARGFSFVGSTIVYAHMQAVGMVNDHLVECFRHRELA